MNKKYIRLSIENPGDVDMVDDFNEAAEVRECGILVKHGTEDAYLVDNVLESYDLIKIKGNKCYWHGIVEKDGKQWNTKF